MIDEITASMISVSKHLSSHGKAELSAHHEAVIQLCGFLKIESGSEHVIHEAVLKSLEAVESSVVANLFEKRDVHLLSSEDGRKAVFLLEVKDEISVDGIPLFWQNYFAQTMIPSVLMVFLEKLSIDGVKENFVAIPYFVILKLSGHFVAPEVCVVGESLRKLAVENPQASMEEAMSNIGLFLPMVVNSILSLKVENE